MLIGELLLTEREAAEALKLCPKTLYHLRRKGELTYVKVGASIRYDRQSLVDWIEHRKRLTSP